MTNKKIIKKIGASGPRVKTIRLTSVSNDYGILLINA